MAYTIRPLHLGDITRPDSGIVYGASPDKKVDFALLSYYLTDGKHKIIVDTGGTPPECAASGPHHPYVRPESQTMEAAIHTTLEACRESMEKVRRVTDKVLPSHDARVLDHDIYPSIERREKSE